MYHRLRNLEKLMEILRRFVPNDPDLTDTQLVEKTAANFWHERKQPLIDPNE